MARAIPNKEEFYFQLGSCKIILKQGDLMCEDNVDVIVIPTPSFGQQRDQQTYPLFDALLSKVDNHWKNQIKRFSSQMSSVEAPHLIQTDKQSYILTSTPYFQNPKKAQELLTKMYNFCLRLAMENKCQSVAFPTIGCGQSGFSTEYVVNAFHRALAQLQESNHGRLKEVRIVVFDKKIYQEFIDMFMNLSQDKNAKIKFIEISSIESRSNKMPSKDDNPSEKNRHRQGHDAHDEYPDDFENDDRNLRRDHPGRSQVGLNPNSQEFRPKNSVNDSNARCYHINNGKTELHIIKGDILNIKVDAIVNAANESMLGGSGVDGAIHKAAGDELYQACKRHKEIFRGVRLPTGRSRILLSYKLPKAYYIINTAGPRYDDHPPEKCNRYLTSCYETSLALANLYDLETIAYTAISCGIFGYPPRDGARIALSAVDTNAKKMKKISFVLNEEELYKIWIEEAERLQSTSMDPTDSKQTRVSSALTTHASKTSKVDDKDDNQHVSKEKTERTTNDRSTKPHSELCHDPLGHRSLVASVEPDESQNDGDAASDDIVHGQDKNKKNSERKKDTHNAAASKESPSKKSTPMDDSKSSSVVRHGKGSSSQNQSGNENQNKK